MEALKLDQVDMAIQAISREHAAERRQVGASDIETDSYPYRYGIALVLLTDALHDHRRAATEERIRQALADTIYA